MYLSPTSFEVYSFLYHGIFFLYMQKMYSCIYFIPEQSGIVSYLFRSILVYSEFRSARMLLCELPLGWHRKLGKGIFNCLLVCPTTSTFSSESHFYFLNFCVSVRFQVF